MSSIEMHTRWQLGVVLGRAAYCEREEKRLVTEHAHAILYDPRDAQNAVLTDSR
jgi:hypothetical protein